MLISVPVFSPILDRKWALAIQDSRGLNGCSTIWRRTPFASGMWPSQALHLIENVLELTALRSFEIVRGAFRLDRTAKAGADASIEIDANGYQAPDFDR